MPKGNDWQRVLICSDIHGVFCDFKAFSLLLQVASSFPFDACIVNGDFADFPTISDHSKKIELLRPELLEEEQYGLDAELTLVENHIIKPLRKALGKKSKLTLRIGNHEFRLLHPNRSNAGAVAEILAVQNRRKEQRLEGLLHLSKYDAKLSYNAQDRLFGSFTLIHGDKTSQNAAKANLLKYGSGTSGHSHRGNCFTQVLMGKIHGWWESCCLRTVDSIEYLPFGVRPDWVQGFLTLWINKSGHFFCTPHFIIDGKCVVDGQLFRV